MKFLDFLSELGLSYSYLTFLKWGEYGVFLPEIISGDSIVFSSILVIFKIFGSLEFLRFGNGELAMLKDLLFSSCFLTGD